MKIAYIGAGSYVFGPSILSQIYLEQGLDNIHLALVDPDIQVIELLANIGRRMARERALNMVITYHSERIDGLVDADFVICSASPQMQKRTAIDWEIIDSVIPGHQKSEFGGIAGISYSLRQIALVESIAEDIRRLCPNAWFLNASNPLPRVIQAVHECGIKTAGFCVAASSVYSMLWEIFYGTYLSFPFTEAIKKWRLKTGGLNHFSWLVEFYDRESGVDLYPILKEQVATGKSGPTNPVAQRMLGEIGWFLVPGDDHTKDFIAPEGSSPRAENPWHGNTQERQRRLDLLRAVGDGIRPWDDILVGQAWEKPISFIDALSGGQPARFHAMNLVNEHLQIPSLPSRVFVETPCSVTEGKVTPESILLPEATVALCDYTAKVTDTIVQAALSRSKALVYEAVYLDPTILNKTAGREAIDLCLSAHSDLLPAYS